MSAKPLPEARYGIDRIAVYAPPLALSLEALAAERPKVKPGFPDALQVVERSVAPPFEDTVTMAVNAALDWVSDEDRSKIRLLIVGSESSFDAEKPISSWVHRHLGLSAGCRNFEVKHACYAGTAAVRMALAWLAQEADPEARALVVTSDFSEAHFHKGQEFVLGCGGVAMLLSAAPRLAQIETHCAGVHAHEIDDLFRPAPGVEMGDPDQSLMSYFDGLDGAYSNYRTAVQDRYAVDTDQPGWIDRFVFHLPFPEIGRRAYRRLMTAQGRPFDEAEFLRQTGPSLEFGRRVGGTYAGGAYVALASLLAHDETLGAGDRIGLYSYGSGSCAEFYTMRLAEASSDHAVRRTLSAPGLSAALDSRIPITVAQYEALEERRRRHAGVPDNHPDLAEPPCVWERGYAHRKRLVLKGVEGFYRDYQWSSP